MDILKRIDELRNKKGWTMYKLAEECMLTQSTLANMYARNTLPSLTTLISICNGLGITPSEFFCENDKDMKLVYDEKFLVLYNKLTKKEKDAVLSLMENLTK